MNACPPVAAFQPQHVGQLLVGPGQARGARGSILGVLGVHWVDGQKGKWRGIKFV